MGTERGDDSLERGGGTGGTPSGGLPKGPMATLYRSPFFAELVATATAICASDVEAEGLVQEAFLEDWHWRPPIGEGGADEGGGKVASDEWLLAKAKGFLRTKVVWRARTARRKRDRRAAKQGEILYESRLARNGEGNPADEYRRRRRAELLSRAVAALGEEQRAAWLLVRARGRSYASAAEALGCSGKALEQRLYRARRRIREWFEERGFHCLDDIG